MSIFKEYDIRGIYPEEINEETIRTLAPIITKFLKKKRIMIARDARKSSPTIARELKKELTKKGITIIDIGMCSTPEAYFTQNKLGEENAIIITASHNPPEYNGLKIMGPKARPIGKGQGLEKIEKEYEKTIKEKKKKEEKKEAKKKKGIIIKKKASKEYEEAILKGLKEKFNYKAIIDNSNSPAKTEIKTIKKMCEVIKVLNEKPDGTFPGHSPDPLKKESQKKIKEEIKEKKADLGIIFDGDADRIVIIDEKGKTIPPDLLTIILAENYKKGTIIIDPRSSKAVKEFLEEKGHKVIISKAGRSNIAAEMRKRKAIMGAEKSGHYFFKETNGMECTALAARKVMQTMKKKQKPLSKIIKEYKKYESIPEKNYKVKNPEKIIKKIEEKYKKEKITRLDGITVEFNNGSWFNIRKSNTVNGIIRLNAEAKDKKELTKIVKEIEEIIKKNKK